MTKMMTMICVLFLLIPAPVLAKNDVNEVQIAFVYQNDLWINNGQENILIATGKAIQKPKWSKDGTMLAYTRNSKEIWVYNIQQKNSFQISTAGIDYDWSPIENTLAYRTDSMLNIINLENEKKSSKNVALGVYSFSWFPNGEHLIAASQANVTPAGWGSVQLFKIPIEQKQNDKNLKPFYTLPSEGEKDDFFAIGTSIIKFSPDSKWMAFLAVPTVSWSSDSNNLCLLSSDGKEFKTIDKMILQPEWYKWAPSENKLAYISGEGRITLQNKDLKVMELPASSKLTPEGFVDWDFTWVNDTSLVVSRAKESEWSNEPKQRPFPQLVKLNIENSHQENITSTRKGIGDYFPYYSHHEDKLYWIRTNKEKASVWKANRDGSKAEIVVKNLDLPPVYYEAWSFEDVISFYE
jgi:dipeptidyl aminopeptidase/acylaminoacyl peptidase